MSKIRLFLTIFGVYITIAGLVTFSLFMIEESFQTAMFGTWPAQDAQRWDLVKKGSQLMKKISTTGKVVNYMFGWVQPLAFVSYRSYFKSSDFYIEALNAKALANAPELYAGEKITLDSFVAKSAQSTTDGYSATMGAITVVFKHMPQLGEVIRVEGRLQLVDGRLVIFNER